MSGRDPFLVIRPPWCIRYIYQNCYINVYVFKCFGAAIKKYCVLLYCIDVICNKLTNFSYQSHINRWRGQDFYLLIWMEDLFSVLLKKFLWHWRMRCLIYLWQATAYSDWFNFTFLPMKLEFFDRFIWALHLAFRSLVCPLTSETVRNEPRATDEQIRYSI